MVPIRLLIHFLLSSIGLWCLFVSPKGIQAQSKTKIKRLARIYYQEQMLVKAHPYFIQSIKNGKRSTSWLMKAGESCLAVNDLKNAYKYFNLVIERKGKKEALAYKLLGITLQRLHQFDGAIHAYKQYLRYTNKNETSRKKAKYYILQCRNGLTQKLKPSNETIVENAGLVVNDAYDQMGMVQSKNDGNKFYFTSQMASNQSDWRDKTGKVNKMFGYFKTDIFQTSWNQGTWSPPTPANELLNTPLEDILMELGEEGRSMIYYKGLTRDEGKVYVDSFDIYHSKSLNNSLLMKSFTPRISGDKGLCLYKDSICIFSSKEGIGFGGYDLYLTIKRGGAWLTPVNLGPQVNSPFDEITPFLCNNGRTLYFSSNSTKSIGGFDIFKIALNDHSLQWTSFLNVGLPINSGSDDTHYRGSKDGMKGTFTSDRPGGLGQQDIYLIYYNKLQIEQLTLKDPGVYLKLYNELSELNPLTMDVQSYLTLKKGEIKTNRNKDHIVLRTITRTQNDFLTSSKNRKYIDKVIQILKQHKKLKIVLSSHSWGIAVDYQLLYTSYERLEKLRSYILSAGIEGERILSRAYGKSYPLTKTNIDDVRLIPVIEELNNRIEIDFIGNTGQLIIDRPVIKVPKSIRNPASTYPKGLNYRILLATSNKIMANPLLSKENKASMEYDISTHNYAYYISAYKQYKNAKEGLGLLNQNVFNEAKIVPFIGSVRISKQQIADYSMIYPDLVLYLEDNP